MWSSYWKTVVDGTYLNDDPLGKWLKSGGSMFECGGEDRLWNLFWESVVEAMCLVGISFRVGKGYVWWFLLVCGWKVLNVGIDLYIYVLLCMDVIHFEGVHYLCNGVWFIWECGTF